jgi:hypothetical protein
VPEGLAEAQLALDQGLFRGAVGQDLDRDHPAVPAAWWVAFGRFDGSGFAAPTENAQGRRDRLGQLTAPSVLTSRLMMWMLREERRGHRIRICAPA